MHTGTTTVTHVTVLEATYPLLLRLLSMGVAHIADALTAAGAVDDPTAEMWVCIIHLLHAMDDQAFWDVWDPAWAEWLSLTRSSPLVACERTWYALFVVCALSHFHASTGMAGHTSYLRAHWPAVQRLVQVAACARHADGRAQHERGDEAAPGLVVAALLGALGLLFLLLARRRADALREVDPG